MSERAIFEEVTDNIGIAATTKKVRYLVITPMSTTKKVTLAKHVQPRQTDRQRNAQPKPRTTVGSSGGQTHNS